MIKILIDQTIYAALLTKKTDGVVDTCVRLLEYQDASFGGGHGLDGLCAGLEDVEDALGWSEQMMVIT